jgi:hypothetical protein
VLEGQDAGQLVGAPHHQVIGAPQDLGPLVGRQSAPGPKCARRGGDRIARHVRAGRHHVADRLAGGGVADLEAAGALGV